MPKIPRNVIPYTLERSSHRIHVLSLNEQSQINRRNRRRKNSARCSGLNCKCLLCFLVGLGALLLFLAIIIMALVLSGTIAKTTTTTANNNLIVASTMTTVTDTTTTTSTVSTTTSTESTTSITTTTSTSSTTSTSTTTTTTTTTTTSTTAIPCSPACTSQQTCINGICVGIGHLSCTLTWSRPGDGDIVVTTPNSNIIYYSNKGPSVSTDNGELDVDNKNGTGPENVFWSNSSSVPPTGVYYVCFSQYDFSPNATSTNPIRASVQIIRTSGSVLTFTKNFTFFYQDYSTCNSFSVNLLASFTYP